MLNGVVQYSWAVQNVCRNPSSAATSLAPLQYWAVSADILVPLDWVFNETPLDGMRLGLAPLPQVQAFLNQENSN